MATQSPTSGAPAVCYVDAVEGALAALAAGVAHSLGRTTASAATSSPRVDVPREVATVLAEVGAALPPVALSSGKVGTAAPAGEVVDLASWGLALYPGEGELERLALARIARDRIERRLSE